MIDFNTKRHDQYKEYEDMYNNYEDDWSIIRKLNFSFEHPYLPLALPREISHLYSDLAFGNPINAIVKNNKDADNAIDEIIGENQLNAQLSEAGITQSYKGGIVFKNYLDEGKSRITFIEPDYYFPVTSTSDRRKIIKEVIAVPYFDESDNKQYLYTETYEKREDGFYWCVSQTYTFNNNKKGKAVTDQDEVNTQLTQSPITYIPFIRSGTNFWGDSIYKGLTPLFDELNHRVTQISNVLDIHSDPSMWAVSSVFDDDGNLKIKGNKVFEVDETNEGNIREPMGYIVWDWSGEWNFRFIEDIIYKALHYVSPLAPALYGLDKSSQASGRAILLKSWRSQCKISRSYIYWQSALKKILYLAQQLQIISGEKSYVPAIPNIELKMNLPIDFYERVQAEQVKVDAGLSSKKSAIARINPHMTSQEVEEEWLEIIEEQNQVNKQTFMNDMTGLSSQHILTDDDNEKGNDTE